MMNLNEIDWTCLKGHSIIKIIINEERNYKSLIRENSMQYARRESG